MTLPIERARSRRPITWLTLIGVLLLPAIIGGILVTALQNPTDRLESMTAAVVNLDKPVTIDDQYTPLGRELASGLVKGSNEADSNLTWVISNEKDAARGLGDGTYQAIVTIPKSFSADATSAGTALKNGTDAAEQAKITVTTPPDGRVADDLITNQIASVAASSMGTMLSEATVGNVLIGFTTIGDQIGDAADGAAKLADGARVAANGAAELPGGALKLADGARGLADGGSSLAGGLSTISSKAREAASGAKQLGQGLTAGAAALQRGGLVPSALTDAADTARDVSNTAAQAAGGAAQAADGAAQASAGVRQGVDQLAPGLQNLAGSCDAAANPQFCAQLSAMANAADSLRAPAGTAADLAATAATAAAGAQQAAAGASQASAGVATGLVTLNKKAPAEIAAQMRIAGGHATELGSGLGQLAGGVSQSASGASALASGATQLGDGAAALADGAGELATGLDSLAAGSGDLADGLKTASTSLPSFDEQQSSELASVIANPVKASSSGDLFGPTAIPLLSAVVLWFGALASFIALHAVPGNSLTSRRSSFGMVLRGFWPAAALGAAQGVLVALIVQLVAGYDAATWWAFAGFAALAGISFAAVNQALVTVFGGIGRWVSALIGVVAVATGLISTIPAWLADLGAAMPTAPALGGLIAANGSAAAGLIVWAVLSLIAATFVVATRRTTSVKAVLAAA